jgi:hypothetical protein
MKGYVDGQVTTLNSTITTANTAVVSYVNAQLNNVVTNANANTAAYLSNGISTNIVTTGNVNAGNVNIGSTTYANLSITSTATAADFTIGQVGATGNLVLNRQTNFAKDAHVTGNVTVSANITAANVNATLHGNVVGVATGLATAGTTFAGTFLTGQQSISPGLIAKTSASTQTFTITGLTTSHKIVISPANDLTYGIYITAAYVSAANTVSIQFQNTTGGGVTPATMNINYFAWV